MPKKKDKPIQEEEKEVKAPTNEDTDRLHKRKTKEELQEEIDGFVDNDEQEELEEEEKPEDTDENEEPETPEEEEPEEEEKPKEDLRKRYESSSREAQILYAKNKKMTEAIEKASNVPEPTEEELVAEFPDWEEMSDFERKMAKDSIISKRKLDAISEVAKDFKDMNAWNKKVDDFLVDPITLTTFPELDGKEEEFKIFVSKETRRGVDFETLVSAFLYTSEDEAPAKKKGKMFETGSGGLNKKPVKKANKISVEESIRLRQTNYKEYVRLLREGKIDNTVI